MMKDIRKPNGQIFEVITSRKELAKYVNDIADNRHVDSTDDVSYYWMTKDGKSHWDGIPNIANIVAFVEDNGTTNVIYGAVAINYNEHYEDWEVEVTA